MEKKIKDLESTISTQKEQLLRYEKRLKDVVTAYKGLLKEKEALEASLSALSSSKEAAGNNGDEKLENSIQNIDTNANAQTTSISSNGATALGAVSTSESTSGDDDRSQLQTQIITLMNSLATLSAEKSRMEASFQADKKQLRAQIAQKEQTIDGLQQKIIENAERAKCDVDEVKAKWIIERQEREKESNNQMLMIRELQKLYADERHLKENIEMQLNNFKTQFASNEAENSRLRELQMQLKEAKLQLKQLQTKHSKQGIDETEMVDSVAILQQVQQEMQQLKEQHAVAIKTEQRRALRAEEKSRKQAALHEDRVANLEARLAELSNTVGTYDRLRQQDQESIQVLKRQLKELDTIACRNADDVKPAKLSTVSTADISALVDELVRIKKLLVSENARSTNPIDLSKVLAITATDHVECQRELQMVQQQLDAAKLEIIAFQEKINVQKSHITTLQDKVKVLNRNIDETEAELKLQNEKLRQAVKEERDKWKEVNSELENEMRCKVNELEQQLQKQRQRSLQLLDEKEQEIKTLQTSFEIFHSATSGNAMQAVSGGAESELNAVSSDAESIDGATIPHTENHNNFKLGSRTKKLSLGENCHMLHYANELARKDIEIASLRKSRHAAETSLRRAIQEKVTAQQDLNDQIEALEQKVDRLERCQTREGANLEYLKNVIISYIASRDGDGKRHMLNAISAVLQLTDTEIQTINASFQKK